VLAAFFLKTYGGFMLKIEDITEDGEPVGEGTPWSLGGYVLKYSGALYPFDPKGMLNPLDPVNLVLCWPLPEEEEGEVDDDFESVLNTMLAVTQFRKKGFEVVTKYKSGAARTIKLADGSDTVVILGDYAKSHKLLLPILSTQLSESYDQSAIELWNSLGFKTPPHYGIYKTENTYSVDGWQGASLLSGEKTITYYNIIGGGKKVVVKKTYVDAEVQEISDSDNRDWDFGNIEHTEYHITVTPISNFPTLKASTLRSTTPQFVWEDKNDL